MKYKKKIVVVEAFQITEELALKHFIEKEQLPLGISLSGQYHPANRKLWSAWAVIETRHGNKRATVGDWIIKGGDCKLDVLGQEEFNSTYELYNL
jgi:hypothetical protein